MKTIVARVNPAFKQTQLLPLLTGDQLHRRGGAARAAILDPAEPAAPAAPVGMIAGAVGGGREVAGRSVQPAG
jgi:hypothetical protein